MEALPDWVEAFNERKLPDSYFGKQWERLLPASVYEERAGIDARPNEENNRQSGITFPHTITGGLERPGTAFHNAFKHTPWSNDVELAFARQLIIEEQLGDDDIPDVFVVSLSGNDYVGHDYGPFSQEVLDMTLRTDRQLADFMAFIDERVGLDRSLLVLTSDHGVVPLPEELARAGMAAGRVATVELTAFVEKRLDAALGEDDWVRHLHSTGLYLNLDAIERHGLRREDVEQLGAQALVAHPGVAAAYTRTQILNGQLPDTPLTRRVTNSFHPDKSGDVHPGRCSVSLALRRIQRSAVRNVARSAVRLRRARAAAFLRKVGPTRKIPLPCRHGGCDADALHDPWHIDAVRPRRPRDRGNFAQVSRRALALVTAMLLAGPLGHTQQETITAAPAFTPEMLEALPTTGWLTNGGNVENLRYSPLDEINRETVDGLGAVWRVRLEGSGVGQKYSGEAQPIVYDGVVYVVTGADDVFAISVDSGRILWRYTAKLDPDISTVCCGWTSRGVGLGDGKVFVGQLDGKLVALDQRTGEPVWSVQAARWQEGYTITSAPLYYDGLVITGFAGGEHGIRGRVSAFSADDGAPAWVFYTIPGPGEFGHDTWPRDNDVWMHGGAAVWQTPAVDPELGLLYVSTGNPGPDFNGAVRAGDNLFSVSILAIDVDTGEYRWHFQQVHHDLWDYDSASPVVLFDVAIDGVERKAIAEASKTGWVYILDRTNGEPLIGIEERAVPQEPRQATAATQPYPIGDAFVPQSIDIAPEGYTLVNQGRIFTPFWTEGAVAKPSPLGGTNWQPTAYDPTTATLYVCASDKIQVFTGGDSGFRDSRRRRILRWRHVLLRSDTRDRHLRGGGHADQSVDLAPAMGRYLLQRFACHRRRTRLRRAQRRPPHGARLQHRCPPVGVPDRRRGELRGQHLRSRRRAARGRLLRRKPLRRIAARGQRVALLAEWHARAGHRSSSDVEPGKEAEPRGRRRAGTADLRRSLRFLPRPVGRTAVMAGRRCSASTTPRQPHGSSARVAPTCRRWARV